MLKITLLIPMHHLPILFIQSAITSTMHKVIPFYEKPCGDSAIIDALCCDNSRWLLWLCGSTFIGIGFLMYLLCNDKDANCF